jgi:hypothetical protein
MDTTNGKLKEGPATRLAMKYGISLRDFCSEVQFKLLIKAIAILISPVEKGSLRGPPDGPSFLLLKVVAQQDRFRELLHRFSPLPALSLQCEVGFFLGNLEVALQDSLGPLD